MTGGGFGHSANVDQPERCFSVFGGRENESTGKLRGNASLSAANSIKNLREGALWLLGG